MSAAHDRIFVARLAGPSVFDPLGDPVGRVRDVVLLVKSTGAPTAVGLVVEVPGRRRVFLPLTRVTSVAPGQVICTGVVNLRRFKARPIETLAMADLFERSVVLKDTGATAYIEDLAFEQTRARTWTVTKLFVRSKERRKGPLGLSRKGEGTVVDVDAVTGLAEPDSMQGAALILHAFADYKPADLAAALLGSLRSERAADVLEAMDPDDAADLLGDLPEGRAAELLNLMTPEDARNVRQLLSYEDDVAGGLMTTEPVIVGPESTVANALAILRREEITASLASMIFVVRPPLETPTGRYLGLVHIQRLLREAPQTAVGTLVDPSIEPLAVTDHLAEVARRMATYDTLAAPVVDDEGHLLGVVSVDDVLDHLLPVDWREHSTQAGATHG